MAPSMSATFKVIISPSEGQCRGCQVVERHHAADPFSPHILSLHRPNFESEFYFSLGNDV